MTKIDGWGPVVRRGEILGAQLTRLQHELSRKQDYANRLEVLLRSRTKRIDELANAVATLRDQNRRLDQECERLVDMVRLSS